MWTWLGRRSAARGALAGVNAAVVGVLGAALYDPIWRSAVVTGTRSATALAGFLYYFPSGGGRRIIVVVLARCWPRSSWRARERLDNGIRQPATLPQQAQRPDY